MFQYAFGCAREAAGDTVRFDVVHGFAHDLYRRSYVLGAFDIDVEKAQPADVNFGMDWRSPFHRFPRSLWRLCPKKWRQVHYERFPFDYEPYALEPSNPARYYWGYWQNPNYVEPIADCLRHKLRLRRESPEFVELRAAISARGSLSIHVRRYNDLDKSGRVITSARHHHGVCDEMYFQRALGVILARECDPAHAYVFSDDLEWCKTNLRFNLPHSYVSDLHAFSEAEELMLMAACKNHIISNSSFSWWGAWLGQNPRKIVVAPRMWNKTLGKNENKACPSNWIRV